MVFDCAFTLFPPLDEVDRVVEFLFDSNFMLFYEALFATAVGDEFPFIFSRTTLWIVIPIV